MRTVHPALLISLCLLACEVTAEPSPGLDGSPSGTDAGPSGIPDGPPPRMRCMVQPSREAPTETVAVGEREQDVFVSFDDDPTARYAWGFQGGTMIRPVLGLPRSLVGDEDCFQVILRHSPDPAAPDAFGDIGSSFGELVMQLRGEVDGDTVWIGPIDDQIGFEDLDGTRLTLEVEVRGESFVAAHSVVIEIPDWPEACDALERTSGLYGSCGRVLVPGSAIVTAMAPDPDTTGFCLDPQRVEVRFEPDDPALEVCFADNPMPTDVYRAYDRSSPPASCLGGVEVGSRFEAQLGVLATGDCGATQINFQIPGCFEACTE